MTHDLGNLDNTRSPEQRAAYEKNVAKGVCPFCGPTNQMPQEIQDHMIVELNYWRAWHNPFPYPGHTTHIIMAPIEHWTMLDEVDVYAANQWFQLNVRLQQEFKCPGGGLVMRFGQNEYKGGSISHLHSHIQVPNLRKFSLAVFYADDALKEFFAKQAKK